MTQTEALKLALEALEKTIRYASFHGADWAFNEVEEAITDIKEVLEQPAAVVEPHIAEQHKQSTTCGEPVAWMSKDADIVYTSIQVDGCFQHDHIPLYTTPPQRKEPEQKPVALGANIQLALTHLEGIKLRPWHSLTKSRAELAIAVLNRNTTPYVATPRPQHSANARKPLTDEELDLILQRSPIQANYGDLVALSRDIEAAHGIKE